jgi:anaerobic magnesium-protoporphyrin IX monomethyl ester cyclase
MMFRGAYDSDFYRSVRDLLHEQVTLQQANAGHDDDAMSALDARWQALIADERAHRNEHATPLPLDPVETRHVAAAQNR